MLLPAVEEMGFSSRLRLLREKVSARALPPSIHWVSSLLCISHWMLHLHIDKVDDVKTYALLFDPQSVNPFVLGSILAVQDDKLSSELHHVVPVCSK